MVGVGGLVAAELLCHLLEAPRGNVSPLVFHKVATV